MLPGVVPGWSHRKRESNQTPGRALQTGRNVADGSRVTRFGITPFSVSVAVCPALSGPRNLVTLLGAVVSVVVPENFAVELLSKSLKSSGVAPAGVPNVATPT